VLTDPDSLKEEGYEGRFTSADAGEFLRDKFPLLRDLIGRRLSTNELGNSLKSTIGIPTWAKFISFLERYWEYVPVREYKKDADLINAQCLILLEKKVKLGQESERAALQTKIERLTIERKKIELKIRASEIAQGLEEEIAAQMKKTKAEVPNIRKSAKDRVGWVVELAGAALVQFPDNGFGKRDWTRYGVWLTPSYRFPKHFELIAVGRLIREAKRTTDKNVFDVGSRLLWLHRDLGISGELVWRNKGTPQGNATTSYTFKAEYRIAESTFLTASFGKNFNKTDSGDDPLLALFGINFGFGKKKMIKLE